jgi:hypothetical protein
VSTAAAIAAFCVEQVERLPKTHDFVPVGLLAERLGAAVLIRPLLVEAMLASVNSDASLGVERNSSWLVLLDSERFAITEEDIRNETSSSPLPVRLRNTVAHELIHCISFRYDRLAQNSAIKKTSKKIDPLIQGIERKTEKLSPLLLIPQSALVKLSKMDAVTLTALSELRRSCAVSREVLISRLNLLTLVDPDGLRFGTCLENVAVGMGEWIDAATPRLLPWPLYANFAGGRVPEVLRDLKRNLKVPDARLIKHPAFYLNGGDNTEAEFEINDSPHDPIYLRMRVRLAVERVPRQAKSRFIFLMSHAT